MVTSSKRAYATPRSAAPRAPVPVAVHCWTRPPQEMLKHSSVSSLWMPSVLVHTRFVWALWASLAGVGFDSKFDFVPPTILLGLLLCPWACGIYPQLLRCLPSCWGFSDLGCGLSPHGHPSEAQLLLQTLDMGYLGSGVFGLVNILVCQGGWCAPTGSHYIYILLTFDCSNCTLYDKHVIVGNGFCVLF